jgi:NAD(P)H-dependent flavin oxidoreductase YrpB (nitropropane dioxygenase family)
MPAGQIVGRIDQVRPVADVMASLVTETDQALNRLNQLR